MFMRNLLVIVSTSISLAYAHQHDQIPLTNNHESTQPRQETWLSKYGPQIDQPFSGPLSFSHLPYSRCLEDESADFDIAILGMPFDTAVTYRPGARFGPYAIRSGSRRQRESRGYTMSWGSNPYSMGAKIMDCGDVGYFFLEITLLSSEVTLRFLLILSTTHWQSIRWRLHMLLFLLVT